VLITDISQNVSVAEIQEHFLSTQSVNLSNTSDKIVKETKTAVTDLSQVALVHRVEVSRKGSLDEDGSDD
jgi:hypothetical protein